MLALGARVSLLIQVVGPRVQQAMLALGRKVQQAMLALGRRVRRAMSAPGEKVRRLTLAHGEKVLLLILVAGPRARLVMLALGRRAQQATLAPGLRAQRATQHACRSTGVSCLDGARGWLSAFIFEENVLISERGLRDAKMTLAKQAGMEQEAARFYGRARWENVISIGDAVYEHDAVCALKGARDATDPFRKDCHVKAITVPQEPSVQELTESLWLSRHLLPAYVAFDGCLDVDQSEVCLADLFA